MSIRNALVLASSSSYRRALLDRLRLPYVVAAPEIDESPAADEQPRSTALRLAELKARAVAPHFPASLVIGSDQVAVLDNTSISKPGTHLTALAQLTAMSGRSIVFHTALCLLNTDTGDCQLEDVPTLVQFRNFSEVEADRYLHIDRPYDCAGSAKIEALGIAMVEKVESSDPTAIIGLPLIALVTLLKRAGVPVL